MKNPGGSGRVILGRQCSNVGCGGISVNLNLSVLGTGEPAGEHGAGELFLILAEIICDYHVFTLVHLIAERL